MTAAGAADLAAALAARTEALCAVPSPIGHEQAICALVVGRRSASTDKKVSLNQALRDFEVQV